jgi:uncharacterized membrane protein (UPF0127 family)
MKMKVEFNGEKLRFEVKKVSGIRKIFGLMFLGKKTSNLLFVFDKDVNINFHSFFVFFDFLILWLDSYNNVIDYEVVKPFRFSVKCGKKFRKVIEIPINKINLDTLEFFGLSNILD